MGEKLRALDALETVIGRGDRQLLLLDPFDGHQLHAAVGSGDVDTADHVSVFTPGFTSTVQDSLSRYDGQMDDLRRRGSASPPGSATAGPSPRSPGWGTTPRSSPRSPTGPDR